VTQVFNNSKVRGRGTKPPIDKQGRITVRLQGIDAPELHYRPSPPTDEELTDNDRDRIKENNGDFRQYFGETATVALGRLVNGGAAQLPWTVVTRVEHPNDVFDVYGRFVGNVRVTLHGAEVDINTWLAHEGYVFPTFYTSMTPEEIQELITAAATGRK